MLKLLSPHEQDVYYYIWICFQIKVMSCCEVINLLMFCQASLPQRSDTAAASRRVTRVYTLLR